MLVAVGRNVPHRIELSRVDGKRRESALGPPLLIAACLGVVVPARSVIGQFLPFRSYLRRSAFNGGPNPSMDATR